eukprot:2223295-Pyramimonas_sp.AAC.1
MFPNGSEDQNRGSDSIPNGSEDQNRGSDSILNGSEDQKRGSDSIPKHPRGIDGRSLVVFLWLCLPKTRASH